MIIIAYNNGNKQTFGHGSLGIQVNESVSLRRALSHRDWTHPDRYRVSPKMSLLIHRDL